MYNHKKFIFLLVMLVSILSLLICYSFLFSTTNKVNRFVEIVIKEPIAEENNYSVMLGPVILSLPWKTERWEYFFDYGFKFRVCKLGCRIVCINAYAYRNDPEYSTLITRLFNTKEPFHGGEHVRQAILYKLFGKSTLYVFDMPTQKGFLHEVKNGNDRAYIITIFSKKTSVFFSGRIIFDGKIDPQQSFEVAKTLVYCIKLKPSQQCLTKDQFKKTIFSNNKL